MKRILNAYFLKNLKINRVFLNIRISSFITNTKNTSKTRDVKAIPTSASNLPTDYITKNQEETDMQKACTGVYENFTRKFYV